METERKDLGREDWIKAGMTALFEEGIRAVKVDRLAKRLKITRGSFYWHFKDQADLLQSMISHWTEDQLGHAKALESDAGAPTGLARIRAIIERIRDKDIEHDVAMRVWAYDHKPAADAVAIVDTARLRLVEASFAETGLPKADAHFRAHLLYYFQLGDQLSRERPTKEERDTQFEMLTDLLARK
ncbi:MULTISPECIES: TetR/AcrR family transcriptional regulator [Kordiimonas]|jgi:AcrR family transcriptional regulator|uniref:TetR/AcrR family transcriptional regulator n=1 Tax=Kordiimonas TaxID=288021 RepID=UPI00257FC68D|nr:TetR/AcrR family transcriptional regulator [Kordiimonas sp. UBA4487]